MKFKHLFFSSLIAAFVVACSNDDSTITEDSVDNPENENINQPNVAGEDNYFPRKENNEWVYGNLRTDEVLGVDPVTQLDNEETGTETLVVTDSTESESTFENVVEGDVEAGIITRALANGTFSKEDEKGIFDGEVPFEGTEDLTIDIPLENIVIYDPNAEDGETLYAEEGIETSMPIEAAGMELELDISYDVEITAIDAPENVSGYEDLIASQMVLSNLSISIDTGIIGEIEVLEPIEENIVSTNYFANHVGLIKSHTDIDIPFEDLSDYEEFGAPNPDPLIGSLVQTIVEYTIN